MPQTIKLALLDDYQKVAMRMADWDRLKKRGVEIISNFTNTDRVAPVDRAALGAIATGAWYFLAGERGSPVSAMPTVSAIGWKPAKRWPSRRTELANGEIGRAHV